MGLLKTLHEVIAKVQTVVFPVPHGRCSLGLEICLLLFFSFV